jgi:hypothetical protein
MSEEERVRVGLIQFVEGLNGVKTTGKFSIEKMELRH